MTRSPLKLNVAKQLGMNEGIRYYYLLKVIRVVNYFSETNVKLYNKYLKKKQINRKLTIESY